MKYDVNDPEFIAYVKKITGHTPKEMELLFWQDMTTKSVDELMGMLYRLPDELSSLISDVIIDKATDDPERMKKHERYVEILKLEVEAEKRRMEAGLPPARLPANEKSIFQTTVEGDVKKLVQIGNVYGNVKF